MSDIPNPLHPSIIPRLDPEYIAFHNGHLAQLVPPHTLPWNPSIRNSPAVPGGTEPLNVGAVKDFSLSHCQIRTFTPEGSPPSNGWPVFIFFHGGGWTLGNINSENSFSSRMCNRAKCVVVSVDYRLGPEQPYPAAVEDAVESLQWVCSNGKAELGINTNQIAVGGSSSGGNLAAILTMKAVTSDPPIPLVFQLLVVPVTDNTASVSGTPHASWFENANTAWLSPARMLWFRHNYLPNKEDWSKPDSSPIFYPDDLLAKAPPGWVGLAELDILRDEGLAYVEKLREAGVKVDVQIYPGAPHPIMAMDKVLKVGAQLVSDAANALANAFGVIA